MDVSATDFFEEALRRELARVRKRGRRKVSKLAYNRLMNRGMLTGEERRQKEQLIVAIEETLQAKGLPNAMKG